MGTILLVNPSSRGGRRPATVEAVARELGASGEVPVVRWTSDLGQVTALAVEAGSDDVVVVLGGDGTMAAAARGVARSGAALAPLPGGSGNDLCRHLGIPLDPVRAARQLHCWVPRTVDVGAVGDRPVVTMATVGFTADINALADAARVRHPLIYVSAALRLLGRARPILLVLDLDGDRVPSRCWMASLAVTTCQGGGIRTAPAAVADDGLLDVVTYDAPTWAGFVRSLVAALLRLPRRPGVTCRRARTVRVETPRDLRVYADGESVGVTPCAVRVVPGALRLLAPPQSPPVP